MLQCLEGVYIQLYVSAHTHTHTNTHTKHCMQNERTCMQECLVLWSDNAVASVQSKLAAERSQTTKRLYRVRD